MHVSALRIGWVASLDSRPHFLVGPGIEARWVDALFSVYALGSSVFIIYSGKKHKKLHAPRANELLVNIPYSGLFSRRLYFANFAKAQPILEKKKKLMWRRRGSVSPFVKLLFANKNWIGCCSKQFFTARKQPSVNFNLLHNNFYFYFLIQSKWSTNKWVKNKQGVKHKRVKY